MHISCYCNFVWEGKHEHIYWSQASVSHAKTQDSAPIGVPNPQIFTKSWLMALKHFSKHQLVTLLNSIHSWHELRTFIFLVSLRKYVYFYNLFLSTPWHSETRSLCGPLCTCPCLRPRLVQLSLLPVLNLIGLVVLNTWHPGKKIDRKKWWK